MSELQCPRCQGYDVVMKIGKFGKFLRCNICIVNINERELERWGKVNEK